LNLKISRLSLNSSQAYRLFYPQVPVILASKYRSLVAAMPANSCMSVSNDPAMFAISVRKGSKTNLVLKKSRKFSLNWLNFRDRKIVNRLSFENRSRDKLKSLNIPYRYICEVPVLHSSVAYVICQKEAEYEVGDHDLIIGRLLGAMASLDFDENWKFEDYKPVLYIGSDFRTPFVSIDRPRSASKK